MAVKDRPRLGRGLKSLITTPVGVQSPPSASAVALIPADGQNGSSAERFALIPLDDLSSNPHQPREKFDPQQLQDLVASIKVSGVLQPILVRPVEGAEGKYQLVAGHRRVEASRLAGLPNIPAIIRTDGTDERQAEWALIENIHREDLNAIDRARAFRKYIETFHLTHLQAGEHLGLDRATISNFLRLLDLNTGIQDLIARGLLSTGHAKVLAGVGDKSTQDRFANQAVAEGYSVRKLEEVIHASLAGGDLTGGASTTQVAGHSRTMVTKSAHIVDLEQELSRKVGTRVRILPSKKKNTGKIVVQYFSLDEFDRIVEKFN